MAVVMALSTVFSCQKDYDNDIEQLQKDLSSLQETVKNLTYVKSITMDDKGVLTITPSAGSAITYDATKYVKYSIEVKNGNEIYVNGEKVGTITVATPEVKDPTISVVNNELLVNGKSQNPKVMLPEAATPCVSIVKDADGKIVSVTLKDGENEYSISTSSALASLVFIPEASSVENAYYTGYENQVEIPVFEAKAADKAKVKDAEYDKNVYGYILPKYRVNPSNVDITKVDWSMVARWVVVKSAEGDVKAFDIKKVEKYGSSAIAVKAAFTKEGLDAFIAAIPEVNDDRLESCPIFSLCGATKNNDGDPVEVYSDNALLARDLYKAVIANKIKTEFRDKIVTYSENVAELKSDATPADHKVAYDAKDVDLLDYVLPLAATAWRDTVLMSSLNYEDYDFKFENISYVGSDAVTDQSYFVKLEGSKFTPNQGVSGINRKPIFYVQMFDKETGNILAECYIKFQIEREVAPVEQPKKEISIEAKEYNYNELFTEAGDRYEAMGEEINGYTWEQMNALYNELGLDHNTFLEAYNAATVKTVVNGEESGKAAIFTNNFNHINVDSYAFALTVNPYSKFGENTAVTTITPADATKPILVINWKWNVIKPTLVLDVIEGYRYQGSTTTALTKGMFVERDEAGAPLNLYMMRIYIGEAYNYAPALQEIFGNGDEANKVNGSQFTWKLTSDFADDRNLSTGRGNEQRTWAVTGKTGNKLEDIFGVAMRTGIYANMSKTMRVPEIKYDFDFIVKYVNGEEDKLVRSIVFQNPITVKQVSDNILLDLVNGQPDQKDFAKNFNVYFQGKLMVKGGVAMTGDSAVDGEENTIKASDFIDITDSRYGSFFELVLPEDLQYRDVRKVNADGKDGVFEWKNSGTRLQNEVVAAYVKYSFEGRFAAASIEESPIKVRPE